MRTFFRSFIIMKNYIDFFFIRFYFDFLNIYCCIQDQCQILFNNVFDISLYQSQISLYFSSSSLSFIKKDIYLVSSKSLLYFWNHYTQERIFFRIILVPNKIFKTFFTNVNFFEFAGVLIW